MAVPFSRLRPMTKQPSNIPLDALNALDAQDAGYLTCSQSPSLIPIAVTL